MATLIRWVRIQPKQQAQSFYRCGIAFTRDWQEVEVDKATAERLEQEQMLEVTDTAPKAGAGESTTQPAAAETDKAEAAADEATAAETVAPKTKVKK